MFSNLGKPEIYILDEAKNAECAREMLVSGDYVVPRFNDRLRTDKPPLHYFFMAASYKLFGVSAFSARFFSAVFGVLTILLVWLFTRRFVNRRAAVFSALTLLASLHFNLQMRLAVPDPYLIFWMTAAFMSFFIFLSNGRPGWLLVLYLSLGLGILTKGPVALALPGLAMLVFLAWTRRLSRAVIRAFRIPAGILAILAVTLPWYWMNYQATDGAWLREFFFEHNLGRYSDTMEGHGGFFLLPFLMVIIGLLPLGAFSVVSAV
ncbi:MAG TPA: glycosyltransferase family 39 protein, partial [Sphingobacteriaceae bacterium]